MTDFVIRQNDRFPVLNATLTYNDGTVINLTGATVKLLFQHDSTGNTVGVDCAVVSAASGTVSYSWASGDTIWPGAYTMVFLITFSSGRTLSVPDQSNLTLEITPAFIPTSGVVVNGNLVAYLGTSGTTFEDSGIAAADVAPFDQFVSNPEVYNDSYQELTVTGDIGKLYLAKRGGMATVSLGSGTFRLSGATANLEFFLPVDFDPEYGDSASIPIAFGVAYINGSAQPDIIVASVQTAVDSGLGFPTAYISRQFVASGGFMVPSTPDWPSGVDISFLFSVSYPS